jgi:hypothetical protein
VLRFPPTMRTRGTEWPVVDRLLERVRRTCASSIEHDANQLQKPPPGLEMAKAAACHARTPPPPAITRLRRFLPRTGTLAGARYHVQPSAACSTASCQRRSHGTSDRTGHRDGVSRSGWLHAPAVATVLVFEYHVAGRGPVPGRLPLMNRNVQTARGALRKVDEDIRVWTLTATASPRLGDRVLSGRRRAVIRRQLLGKLPPECAEDRNGTGRGRTHH